MIRVFGFVFYIAIWLSLWVVSIHYTIPLCCILYLYFCAFSSLIVLVHRLVIPFCIPILILQLCLLVYVLYLCQVHMSFVTSCFILCVISLLCIVSSSTSSVSSCAISFSLVPTGCLFPHHVYILFLSSLGLCCVRHRAVCVSPCVSPVSDR